MHSSNNNLPRSKQFTKLQTIKQWLVKSSRKRKLLLKLTFPQAWYENIPGKAAPWEPGSEVWNLRLDSVALTAMSHSPAEEDPPPKTDNHTAQMNDRSSRNNVAQRSCSLQGFSIASITTSLYISCSWTIISLTLYPFMVDVAYMTLFKLTATFCGSIDEKRR